MIDVRHIQAILGHADLRTTAWYTHVVIDELKAVHQRAHPAESMPSTRNWWDTPTNAGPNPRGGRVKSPTIGAIEGNAALRARWVGREVNQACLTLGFEPWHFFAPGCRLKYSVTTPWVYEVVLHYRREPPPNPTAQLPGSRLILQSDTVRFEYSGTCQGV